MTPDLTYQRCSNHAGREAVARCPECGRFFCRECVTEHDDRVLCAACLRKLSRVPLARRAGLVWIRPAAECVLGLLVAWFFFFLVAESLLSIPHAFHEETLWQTGKE